MQDSVFAGLTTSQLNIERVTGVDLICQHRLGNTEVENEGHSAEFHSHGKTCLKGLTITLA